MKAKEDYYVVIMAGGGGTRLWPLSRRLHPKQSLNLLGDRTLYQLAVDRILPFVPPERILIATVKEQAELLHSQTPSLPWENFVPEPSPKGTASIIGLTAEILRRRDPNSVMACLTADHLITNGDRFLRILRSAGELARRGEMITLGISPTYPATRYGYIHIGETLGEVAGFEARRGIRFIEKPSKEKAAEYLASGEYAWNSGMFVWRSDRILAEIERQMPKLGRGLGEIGKVLGTPEQDQVLEAVWGGLEPKTIDYGIMEGVSSFAVVPAKDLGWCDIGSWDRLFEVMESDGDGNLMLAQNHVAIDTRNTLVFQSPENVSERLIATLGVEDLIVVDAGDALLVCSREKAEEVRQIVELLKQSGRGALL